MDNPILIPIKDTIAEYGGEVDFICEEAVR